MKFFKSLTELSEWRSFADSDIGRPTIRFFNAVCTNIATKSNKYDIFITFLLVLFQYIPYYQQISGIWRYSGNSHHHVLTVWLLSYDGGFIRRGLAGEIIKLLELLTDLLPHMIITIITVSVFLILVIWTISICGKKIPVYFIFSPVFFALTARADYMFSIDYVMLLLCLCSLKVIVSVKNLITKYILVNTICVFAILVHELYVFICLPILILLYNLQKYNRIISIKFIPFFLFPIISIILVGLNSSGSPELIQKVADYWNEIFRQKIPDFCCFEHGYFGYLKGSWVELHLPGMISSWKLVLYGFVWFPMYWLFVWYFCGLFTAKVIMHYDPGKEKIYLGIYYFCSLCSLPMYILAWDYGRWILMSSIISFLATYTITQKINLPKIVDSIQVRTWKGPLRLWQKVVIVMFFGIPGVLFPDFGAVYYVAPIWYPMQFFISVPELAELGLLGR